LNTQSLPRKENDFWWGRTITKNDREMGRIGEGEIGDRETRIIWGDEVIGKWGDRD
jgi:hypothetical protein